MANPVRGAVPLPFEGKTLNLSFSINAVCILEDHLGQPVAKIAQMLGDTENMRVSNVRAVLWAGLQDYQPDTSLEEAGLIATEIGLAACSAAIGKAFALAFPPAQTGSKTRPQRAAKG